MAWRAERLTLRGRDTRPWFALFLVVVSAIGCQRSFYRRQADAESYAAVRTGTTTPRFRLNDFAIDIDPRSRMYDPTNPDHPPMPPDDPESHRLMHYIDGKRGARGWHRDGDLPDVELSNWQAYLPIDQEGLVVDLPAAVSLARMHSRQYQTQLETLYLSALDVTFERFRFDTQFFGTTGTFGTFDGRVRGGGESSSLLTTDSNLEARRLFAAGGELLVGVANSIVWQFSGEDTSFNSSLANFAFSQPLLRFGGRARILERLTLAERSLLANIRQLERYRHSFYLETSTGRGGQVFLSRQGGFFGGAGLEGFSGVGGGGFGRVGGFGGGGGGVGGGIGALQAGGYIGLLQELQQIRNLEANVAGLRDSLDQLEAAYDAGRLENRFQVDLARQAYYSGQSQLLNRKAAFGSSLDEFKIELGLPPGLQLRVNDPLLDRFRLIDDSVTRLQFDTSRLLDETRNPDVIFDWPSVLERLAPIRTGIEAELMVVSRDIERLRAALPDRRASLLRLSQRPEVQRGELDASAVDPDALDARAETLAKDSLTLTAELRATWERIDELDRAAAGNPTDEQRRALTDELTRLSGQLLELSLAEARARLDAITLTPVEFDTDLAFSVALDNRPDWMNAKANLVDTWRLIRFNANALLSGLDVNISGELGTLGNNPVQFRDTTGQLRAGLEFDAPLTRVAERNVYRQALIEYQQQRRALMAFRDGIQFSLRNRQRQLELDQLNFELLRVAVEVAANQVDLARLKLSQPPKPGETTRFGDSAARDLVSALTDLLDAQNNFLSIWVDYELQRMGLDFDLGTMRLDDQGMWIDPGAVSLGVKGDGEEVPAEIEDEDLPPGEMVPL